MSQSIAHVFFFVVSGVFFVLPYSWEFPGRFLITSIALVAIGLAWKSRYLQKADFSFFFQPKEAIQLLLYILLFGWISKVITTEIFQQNFIYVQSWSQWKKLDIFFQVLNEEYFFRGVILSYLLWVFRSRPLVAILGLALFFSLSHWLHYGFMEEHWLGVLVLGNLFVFALATNLLYFKTGSLLLPFAIHYSWNFNKFGRDLYQGGSKLSEGMGFSLVESHWLVSVLCLGVLAFSLLIKSKKPFYKTSILDS